MGRTELVEILADDSNMPVMRHPGRSFPGSLIQGDSLYCLIQDLGEAITEMKSGEYQDSIEIVEEVIERLQDRMNVYKRALRENGIELPFHDPSS